MAENLLHSMAHFHELFEKILAERNPATIVEVGCEYGGSTLRLAEYAKSHQANLTVIDPFPKVDPDKALADFQGIYTFLCKKSVDALPGMKGDIFFLDGDHNYWTVLSELQAIYTANPDAWVVLHDVGPPCARRDHYYAPDEIPSEHRHAYSHDYGVDLRTGELRYRSGFWGAGDFAIALTDNTARNGVLTAVEDFLADKPNLHYTSTPLIFGVGVIVPMKNSEFIDRVFSPYQGKLCEELEKNRLHLYNDYLALNHEIRGTRLRRLLYRSLRLFQPLWKQNSP